MKLNHFDADEFREWYGMMAPELLVRLDALRGVLGYPVFISTNPDAIGRTLGKGGSTSQHNVDRWGEVRAVDIFPSKIEPRRWVKAAKLVGFRGVGCYPATTYRGRAWAMMHVDTGEHKAWRSWGVLGSGKNRDEVSLEAGIEQIERNIRAGIYE